MIATISNKLIKKLVIKSRRYDVRDTETDSGPPSASEFDRDIDSDTR